MSNWQFSQPVIQIMLKNYEIYEGSSKGLLVALWVKLGSEGFSDGLPGV